MVAKVLEKLDFSDSRNREAVFLAFHTYLFEGHLPLGINVYCFEDFSVGASTNDGLVPWFSVINGIGLRVLWESRPRLWPG